MTIQPGGRRDGRIVVGVDGSAPSRAALVWAVGQARPTDAAVEAVIAWDYPAMYGCRVPVTPDVSVEELAKRAIEHAVAEVSGSAGHVVVRSSVVQGDAARVLLDASKGADRLVVGNRGHRGLAEALLGSVGQRCVHHATCPVVVIRDSVSAAV